MDSLWSQEKLMVSTDIKNVRKAVETSEQINMGMPFEALGPMPIDDVVGHWAAIHAPLCSLEAGTVPTQRITNSSILFGR
jgi:hypothetical protein